MIHKYLLFAALVFTAITSFSKSAQPQKLWDDLSLKDVLTKKPLSQLKPKSAIVVKVDSKKKRQSASDAADQVMITPDYKANQQFLLIRDPVILEELEQKGFDFYSQFKQSGTGGSASLGEFYKVNSGYKMIADTVRSDLVQMMNDENKNKGLPKMGVGMAYSRRLFDSNWFLSPFARFELIGVINRLDRVSFDTSDCGETRFIYRLAYTSKAKNYSRLPLTLMVKYDNAGSANEGETWRQCSREYVKRWTYPDGLETNQQLVEWMISEGPLKENLREQNPHSFELNVQAMRIPSKARAELAGHGTYLLRSFSYNDKAEMVENFLENTPDVSKINSNPELKTAFLDLFKDEAFVHKMSEGIMKLDNKFLVKRAWSYSPYGIARKENRLFDQIITESDLKAVKFEADSFVRSPAAALMRLNDYSCVGCHQARAHAGFHFLGIDKKSTHPLNSIFFEGSGHFEIELKRRSEFMDRIADGQRLDPRRDFSISPGLLDMKAKHTFKKAGSGHFCGLNNGPFSHWVCEDGLQCQSVDDAAGQNILGKCYPKVSMGGDPVLFGTITQDDHSLDKLKITQRKSCGSLEPKYSFGVFDNSGGFPSGICYRRSCKGIDPNSKTEVCADSAGAGFNECIAQTSTGKVNFASCLEKTVMHLGMSRCDQQHACRNDFVCARSVQGEGYCTPSYFLFQVRLDGHADPLKGL